MGECGKELYWSVPAARWPCAGLGAPVWGGDGWKRRRPWKALPARQEGADWGRDGGLGPRGHVTLPQECGDVTGGVAVPKIGEEGGKKKARKSFFPGVPNEVWDGRSGQDQRLGTTRGLTAIWSPLFQAMSGPTWLPPRQLEPARTPQGRALPRGAPGPPPAHGAGKAAPVPPRRPLAIPRSPLSSASCLLPVPAAPSLKPFRFPAPPAMFSDPRCVGEEERGTQEGSLHTCHPPLLLCPHLGSLFPHPSTSAPPQGQFLPPPI